VEVHTVSIPDNLSEPGLPYVDGVYRPLVCGTVRAMEGNAAGFYNCANAWIRCFGDKGDVEDITEGPSFSFEARHATSIASTYNTLTPDPPYAFHKKLTGL